MSEPLAVAYVPALLPSYEAGRYDVVARSREALRGRVEAHGGTLIDDLPVVQRRADAEALSRDLRARGVDLVVLQSATFALGDVVLPFAEAGLRIALWAPTEPRREGPIPLNGFVSMHLHAGVLRRWSPDGQAPYKWLFGDAGHPWFDARLDVTLRALGALKRVEGARVGLIGGVAPTFLNVEADARSFHRRMDLEIVPLELADVIEDAQARRNAEASPELTQLLDALRSASRGRIEVSDEALTANACVYLALRNAAVTHGLDALAVSDWPLFQDRLGLHPGLAFSWLDDRDGVPVAAEGDVGGAASMLLARGVAGEGAMLLDVNDVDLDEDALLTWHCGGSPLNLADANGVRWTPHTTLGRGADPPIGTVADLRFRPGPVTVTRVGDHGARLFALDAEVVEGPAPGFDGSRGWLSRFRGRHGPLSVGDVVQTLIHEGVEHHLALAPGHHAAAVREAAAWSGAALVPLHRYLDELPPAPEGRS